MGSYEYKDGAYLNTEIESAWTKDILARRRLKTLRKRKPEGTFWISEVEVRTELKSKQAFVTRTSEFYGKPELKEFNSLEELLDFQKQIGEPIIIDNDMEHYRNKWGCADFTVEIYDNFRE